MTNEPRQIKPTEWRWNEELEGSFNEARETLTAGETAGSQPTGNGE